MGLVSIIGQKGSGKSAFAEVTAHTAGSWERSGVTREQSTAAAFRTGSKGRRIAPIGSGGEVSLEVLDLAHPGWSVGSIWDRFWASKQAVPLAARGGFLPRLLCRRSAPSWIPRSRDGLTKVEPKLRGLVHHACGLYWKRSSAARRPRARVAVSDRGTLGGLTQFATQFGFAGSATSL